jgi:transcriptional regulator with XRE-family HTH domain
MTIAAYWEEQPENGSSRRAERRRLHLETSGSSAARGAAKVVVHNISSTGMLIESTLPLERGEMIEIDLPHAGQRRCRIVWTDNSFFGCEFDSPLSGGALSAAQLQARSPSEPRAEARSESRRTTDLAGEAFGMRLQKLRKARGMTLMQLALAIGVSKPTVWAWEQERSRPTQDRFGPLARALGVEPADLIPEKNDRALREMLGRFKEQIAQAVGTSPDKVKILLEL